MEEKKKTINEIEPVAGQESETNMIENDIVDQIMSCFKKGDSALLREIKKYNNVDSLVLLGEYRKLNGKDFGFFKKVHHFEGNELFYPILNYKINNIFIAPNNLTDGKTYFFEVKIARLKERESQANPFLLEARTDNIEEVMVLSDIKTELEKYQSRLKEIQDKLENSENELEKKIREVNTQVDRILKEREDDANLVVDQLNQKIKNKSDEFDKKEILITNINYQLSEVQSQLSDYLNKKTEMESTIYFLRQKIDVCKNFEFMSNEDINSYLNVLETKSLILGDKYLDFEKDLSANFPKLATHIQSYLFHKKNLIYSEFQIRNFLTLLMTNDLIVLSGLSGSGKTQIVKSFAEVLGGVAKIIPVKPNWTSSEDLLGYYNPIQSSFLPTPFTEAITEAIQNPNQIYLICLDEMNLARAEYYFADFLSKLEEREEQPEIELYAKHEEELFISEFKTLLTLIESATGEKLISSWQEFLESDAIRNRFFELLGNTEKDTLLQIHSKMRRRLLDILKFPATIRIPNNIRFIGSINVDETTHYFSPKILDRIHIVRFENPLLIEEEVTAEMESSKYEIELKPVYLNPMYLGARQELPSLSSNMLISNNLKELNKDYLLPLSIDFGVRSMRQSINYAKQFQKIFEPDSDNNLILAIAFNAIINQKVLPRFIFDGNEKLKNGEVKIDLLEKLASHIDEKLSLINKYKLGSYEVGYFAHIYLRNMVTNAKINSGQINYFA